VQSRPPPSVLVGPDIAGVTLFFFIFLEFFWLAKGQSHRRLSLRFWAHSSENAASFENDQPLNASG
jgi:hypothetical protein